MTNEQYEERQNNLMMFKFAIAGILVLALGFVTVWGWKTHLYLEEDVTGKLVKIYHSEDRERRWGIYEFNDGEYVKDGIYISDKEYALFKATGKAPEYTRDRYRLEKRSGAHFGSFVIVSLSILIGVILVIGVFVFVSAWVEDNI